MQIEILDWVIAEEAKRPGDYKDEERAKLKAVRKQLVDGGKPIPATNQSVGEYFPPSREEKNPK
jgi:hypothetical protein